MSELRVRIRDGGKVSYGDKDGLEAVREAMMLELGPSCVDVETEIIDTDN